MPTEKSRAIVLKLVDFSETSSVVTLFTEDFGKIGALAKGAKRPKGPFEGALDLLALIRIVFLHKSSESLDLLTEARLERRFRSSQHDLARLYAGYYIAELLAELTDAGDPHRELFLAADAALLGLDTGAPIAETLLRFELAALREAGHAPSLDQCVACGRQVEADRRIAFAMTAGGVLCDDCRPGRRSVVSVSGPVIAAMKQMTQQEGADQSMLDPAIQGELRAVMGNYFAHLLGHRLKTSAYLLAPNQ
jgi:DNA repair protein RecO (recombination protein O)